MVIGSYGNNYISGFIPCYYVHGSVSLFTNAFNFHHQIP